MWKFAVICLVMAPMLGGCVTSRYYARADVTPQQFVVDEAECTEAGRQARDEAKGTVGSQAGLAGAAATGAGRGLAGSIADFKARDGCLEGKGYAIAELSEEDQRLYQQLNPEQRKQALAWLAGGRKLSDFQ